MPGCSSPWTRSARKRAPTYGSSLTQWQHLFREGRQVALAAAGLPSAVSDMLRDDVMSFMRRAERFTLGAVPMENVRDALSRPAELAGRRFEDEALEMAARGTGGYPFLIQLVGYQTWRHRPDREVIGVADARSGVDQATRRVGRLVHEPSLADLSEIDRSFLAAMAIDDGPSRMGDIAARLGVTSVYAGQYRLRLLAAEVIRVVGYGTVEFNIPYLREYLREHVATSKTSIKAGPEDT